MIRGGKSFVSSPPVFSNDAKKLLVCTGDSVSIFTTSTGLQVSELEGHTGCVTSVVVVPASSKFLCFCWTSSLDGTLRYWDFSVPELIKTLQIKFPIHSMVIPGLSAQRSESEEKTPDLFAYISVECKKEKEKNNNLSGRILKYNLTQSRLAGGVVLAETPKPELLTVSSTGRYIGIRDNRKLRIWEVPRKDNDQVRHKKITLTHTKPLSIIAFHPTERIAAAGDVTGRILIWRGIGNRTFSESDKLGNRANEDERPGVRGNDDADSCSTWHWHSSEVGLLLFSSDGAYLYSGGREGVLVVWQLDTRKQKFLPRIGSPLLYFIVSPDPSISSISCADNRIHLLKMPSMEVLKSISGIKLPASVPETYEGSYSGFNFDHTAGLIAVRSENYSIQLYSLFDDREISEVQICGRSHQPGDDVTVIVNLVALAHGGSMMCTVESRLSEEGIGGLVALKFWECRLQNRDFSLSTVIYEPHRDAGVSCVVFHPTRRMAVSSSYGGDFKIWIGNHEIQQEDKMLRRTGWGCHAVGAYKKKPMTAATFSADGSVLAVAADTTITLWDPEKNVLVGVIGDTFESIGTLSYIGTSEYLVSASRGSKPQISVWSMSRMSLSWSYKLQAEAVACTLDGSSLAVLVLLPEPSSGEESNKTIYNAVDGIILLFDAADPVPVASWFAKKAKGGGLAFIRKSTSPDDMLDEEPGQSLLAYINSDHEYVLFDSHGTHTYEQSAPHKQMNPELEDKGQFGYAAIYGELPEFKLEKHESVFTPPMLSERPWETIFSGPSHSLPPLTKLCSVFLESLLEKRTVAVE